MSNVIEHPMARQAVRTMRFLHPTEMSAELTERLVAKMEMLAHEAYLDGRRRGRREGLLNGATIALTFALLAGALTLAILSNISGPAAIVSL